MVRLGVCFCKKDIMSVCDTAGNKQFMCDFFQRHSYIANRCTHHNPDMNDHCWSADAQAFGYCPTKPAAAPVEAEYCTDAEVDEMLSEAPYVMPTVVAPTMAAKRNTCEHCANQPGCPLIPIEAFKVGKNLSNLTPQDYWDIGTACISWCSAMP